LKQQPRYQKGDRIGGRYQVHQSLIGGMGEVYLCLDLEDMVPCALKTFQQRYLEQASRLRRAFEQEVMVWVGLEKHPNIVRCFHMITLDNQPFMVLEWVAGEEGKGVDLRGWLRQGPLALQQALDFAIDICYGLVHAQQKQPSIVHRDLKPENILIAQGGLAKITDFGLAQMVMQADLKVAEWAAPESPAASHPQQSLAAQGGVVGTPPYMPPEQWQPGVSLDERADIYAVGCVLVEMLTRRPPFAVDIQPTTAATYQRWLSAWQWQHAHAARPTFPDTIPAPLAALLVNCLARDRDERPQTITDLLARLQQVYTHFFGRPPRPAPVSSEFSFVDYNNRGITYHALQQHQAALADFNRAIDMDPNYATAYYNRGITYHALQQHQAALADFNRAIDMDPNYAPAYSGRGNIYAALQQYQATLADFSRAIDLDPNDAQAYSNRGATYAALQQYQAALADCSRAIELDSNYAQAYFSRGNTYDALQQHQAALAAYSRAIDLNPNYAMAYNNRGATYHDLQQHQAALADYSRAIEMDPNYARAYCNRGNTYAALQRHQAALADYSRAIDLDPNLAQAYYNRGLTYAALQQHQAALADFSRAIDLDPNLAQAYYNRGNTYDALQQHEAALADYSRTIDLYPNYAQAYSNLGALLANQGQLREALRYFEKAAQLGDALGAQHAARVRQTLGIESLPGAIDPAQQVFETFQQAGSLVAMRQAVASHPILIEANFITAIEKVIDQQVRPEHRPAFEQRVTWLRQIAQQSNHQRRSK
jgi:tetratricopeptide (TPR) repeat protein